MPRTPLSFYDERRQQRPLVNVFIVALCIALSYCLLSPVRAVMYDVTVTFDLKPSRESRYTPTYPSPYDMTNWPNCPRDDRFDTASGTRAVHHSLRKSSAEGEDLTVVEQFQSTFEAPLEALQSYYEVITDDSFLLDYDATITVALGDTGLTLSTARYKSYVAAFALPKNTISPSDLDMKSITFFFYNQPRLHCLYNAPILLSLLETAKSDTAVRERAIAQVNRFGCCPARDDAAAKPREDATVSGREAKVTSLGAPLSARSGCSCQPFLLDKDTMMSNWAPFLLTDTFMQAELNLQVMVFDAETWYRLTSGASGEEKHYAEAFSPPDYSTHSSTAVGGVLRKLKENLLSTMRGSKSDDRATSPKRPKTAAQKYPYNLVRDPAKICSAPALYTVPLAPLLASHSSSTTNTASYYTAATSPNITHRYPPVRVVVVVAQCSAVPLTISLTVSLANSRGYTGSAQYHYSSVMYFVFMVGYAIIFILFLVMIVRCEKRKRPAKSAATAGAAAVSGTEKAVKSKKSREGGEGDRGEEEEESHDDDEEEEEEEESDDETDSEKSGSLSSVGPSRRRQEPHRRHHHQRHHHRLGGKREDGKRQRDASFSSENVDERNADGDREGPRGDGSTYTGNDLDDMSDSADGSGADHQGNANSGSNGDGEGRRSRLKKHSSSTMRKKRSSKSCSRRSHVVHASSIRRFFSVIANFFRRGFHAFQAWWKASHIDIMYPALQWILVVTIPLKILIMILRAAQFSLLAGKQVLSTSYALPTVSVVLTVCASVVVFVLEVLVALGWGLAFSRLSTGRIVVLSLACICAFIIYVASSTCAPSGWSDSFTKSKYMRSETSQRCRAINYTRVAVETFFHAFNAILMILIVNRLGRIVGAYVASPRAPLTEEDMSYFYKLHTRDHGGGGGEDGSRSGAGRGHRATTTTSIRGFQETEQGYSRSPSSSPRREKFAKRHEGSFHRNGSNELNDSLGNANMNRQLAEAELEKRRKDEAQVKLMKLFLRYRSMRMPFCFLVIFPVLFLIFSFTFYDVGDYYMEIFFSEIPHLYLFCFIILFMRHDSFYC